MHDAYEIFQLLKLTVQIESIAAYDDNLLVGTKTGHLLMYSILCRGTNSYDATASGSGANKHDVQLLRYNKNFSKKPIQQLAVVPDYQILVSLSDNVICVHDMNAINFPTMTTVHRTKGATLFALDIKKYTSLTGETTVAVRMCVAVKRRLQLFYWKNGSFLDLRDDVIVSDIPRALAWCDETICVGFKGEYCLVQLSNSTGTQQELFPMGKHQEPSVTKLSNGIFALGKDQQSIFMTTTATPAYKHAVKWSDVPVAIAYDEPYLVAVLPEGLEVRTLEPGAPLLVQSIALPPPQRPRLVAPCRRGLLYLASPAFVWCLQAAELSRQISTLLEQRQFQLALRLTNISDESEDEKSKNIYHIQTLYAFDLFKNKQFHESMKEFLKLGTDPYDVIRLFPDLLPQETRQPTLDSPDRHPIRQKLQDRELENALLALIEFLTEVRLKLMAGNTVQNKAMGNNVNNNNNYNIRNSDNVVAEGSNMNKSTQQLLQIIDTTLLKCYLQTNDALVAPLLRLNQCHLVETEKTLRRHQKYSELVILYQTKGLHRKALELLQKQADQVDSALYGHERTIQYLQHLGKDHINLIFDFAGWVLERSPEEGLRIFTDDLHEVEQLPRPKVLDFLLRNHRDLVVPYLEHVIHVWQEKNCIFHNALVHQYREHSLQLLQNPETFEAGRALRVKLQDFLEVSEHYTPETVLIHFPYDNLFEERATVLGKLGRHEQALSIYVSVLGDVEQAMRYCDKVYRQQAEGADEVYAILMRMLVNPPESWLVGVPSPPTVQPDLEAALTLLEQHASKIHPVKALTALPDRVPLIRIKHFLESSLQHKLSERRTTQVLKGLLYAEHLQVQEMRMQYESQSITMTEFNVCPVCKKRFGNQSAFARYPNGDIVHYSCQERRTT
ncbi:vam6/Vps39-like protein [Schistocerca serialis cubense]|uniref:vam6/Vps39-like protein n=1 Tax=Schistocerca serialis cubense TaxID=2023355 RepID=UPI00214E0E26|nr:vam6/Vps39-like protein [Schistocerca serialis cubense]